MKKIYLALIALVAVSCQSPFLDNKLFTDITPDNYYNTEDELEGALTAAYSQFQSSKYYDHEIFQVADIPASFTDTRWKNNVFNNFDIDKSDNNYKKIWEAYWTTNNAINAVICNINRPSDYSSVEVKNRILGEAKFLRALNYFNMVRMYGRVPLTTEVINSVQDNLFAATAPRDSVYALILDDLKFAQAHLYTNTDARQRAGRSTQGAATALLGKVYLTLAGTFKTETGDTLQTAGVIGTAVENYTLALTELNKVINGNVGYYDLYSDYADNFKNEKEGGVEDIFSIQYIQGGGGIEGSQKQTAFAPQYNITIDAYESYQTNGAFYGKFLPAFNGGKLDKRIHSVFLGDFVDGTGVKHTYNENSSIIYVGKYMRDMRENGQGGFTNTSAKDGGENTIVLRFADVLLMHTEAQLGLGMTDLTGINRVRTRAGLDPLGSCTIDQLLDEREKELCFEGHAWFDYARLGKISPARCKGLTTANVIKFYTWPIPQIEVNKNKNLKQSIGWD